MDVSKVTTFSDIVIELATQTIDIQFDMQWLYEKNAFGLDKERSIVCKSKVQSHQQQHPSKR